MTRNTRTSRITLDTTDRKLLSLLQANAAQTAEALGQSLSLSASQAGRRRARLEAEGAIEAVTARIDPAAIGLGVQAFVQVQMARHSEDNAKAFLNLLTKEQGVTSVWTMTGDADYLVRVFCRDLAALNELIQRVLLSNPAVARVHSQIVMDQPKPDSPLPMF